MGNGKVGIGTSSPASWSKLDVNGALSLSGVGDVPNDLALISSESGGRGLLLKARSGSYTDLVVATSGNVGIGTKTPSYLLDVNGTVRYYGVVNSSDRRLKRDIEAISDPLNMMAVNYQSLIAPVVEAIKALYAKYVGHDRELASIRNENSDLKDRLDRADARAELAEKENAAIKAYLCSKDSAAPFCK